MPLTVSFVVLSSSIAIAPGPFQEPGLTLEDVREVVRRAAPAVLEARARIEEARGRRTSSAYVLSQNPLLEVDGGPRFASDGTTGDVDVGLSAPFSIAGKRGLRIDAADAEVAAEAARAEDAVRVALAEASLAFFDVLYAQERLRLAEERESIDREFLEGARRREQAGQAPALEVQLAGVQSARSGSEIGAARAARASALARLRAVLGWLPERPLSVRGDLRDRRRFDLESLLRIAPERPDLQALASEVERARAESRLASARRWPDLALRLGYSRDEGADVVRAGFEIPLPVIDRGQGERQEAEARSFRLSTLYESSRSTLEGRLRLLWEAFESLDESVRILEAEGLPRLEEAERFARTGYEAGYLALPQWLLTRREILETRLLHLQRLLEAARAGLELEFEAGALR
jgi:cobalt-zinc-cadmium efflux system outer membrane protein